MTVLQGILERNNVKCAKLGYGRVWRLESMAEKGRQKQAIYDVFRQNIKKCPKKHPKKHLISRKIGTE